MKTDLFCHEADVCRALLQFDEAPIHKTFAAAIAHLVIQYAQRFLANLQTVESMKSYFHHTSTNVVLFETAAYFWSMLSFDVNETIKHEFDEDKDAIKRGMLDGFNAATSIMKNTWFEFSPEKYALSRIFLYPKDTGKAAGNFHLIMNASEGRDLPVLPEELWDEANGKKPSDFDYTPYAIAFYNDIYPELGEAVATLVSHYLNNRLD